MGWLPANAPLDIKGTTAVDGDERIEGDVFIGNIENDADNPEPPEHS